MGSSTLLTTYLPITATWHMDWVLLIVIVIFLTLESFQSGASRTRALALALPTMLLAVSWFSSSALLGSVSQSLTASPLGQLALHGIILLVLFILFYRIFFGYGMTNGSIAYAFLCGLATTIMLIVVLLQIPALTTYWQFSEPIPTVFGESYKFYWLLVSLAILAFVAG
jgi:hypothetical protein